MFIYYYRKGVWLVGIVIMVFAAFLPMIGVNATASSWESGVLETIYGDDSRERGFARNFLKTEENQIFELVPSDGKEDVFYKVTRHTNQKVRLLLSWQAAMNGSTYSNQAIIAQVYDFELIQTPKNNLPQSVKQSFFHVLGEQSWVVILCRFSDQANFTPHDPQFFNSYFSESYPGLEHYYNEISFSRAKVSLEALKGWYNLPQPRSYYIVNNSANLDLLYQDCTSQVRSELNLFNYDGISLFFNASLDNFAWGARRYHVYGSTGRIQGVTWIPDVPSFAYQSIVAHEVGHGLGLPHSSGPYGQVYDSKWDLMSGGYGCANVGGRYNCIPAQTIAYHKDRLGWITGAKKYAYDRNRSVDINLQPVDDASSINGFYQYVTIPIGSGSSFYTLELRYKRGYDASIPFEGLIIHQVDPNRLEQARVVDMDNNGNVNDAGAVLAVGERFEDRNNDIIVRVNSRSEQGYNITIATFTPDVEIVSPTNNQSINEGDGINLTAQVRDLDGSVAKVEFYQNNQKIGESYNSPYSIALNNLTVGQYIYTARAYDNQGQVRVSSPVSLNVRLGFSGWQTLDSFVFRTNSNFETFANKLYDYSISNNGSIWQRVTENGQAWSSWQDTGGQSNLAISTTVFQNKVWQSAVGLNSRVYHRSSQDGQTWSNWIDWGGATGYSTTLVSFNSSLYEVAVGFNGFIYFRRSQDGQTWSSWSELSGQTFSSVEMVVFQNRLFQFARGVDNKIYQRESQDGQVWSNWADSGGVTEYAVTATVVGDRLYQVAVGSGDRVFTRYTANALNWSNWSEDGGQTRNIVAMQTLQNKLYQGVRGLDGRIYYRSR